MSANSMAAHSTCRYRWGVLCRVLLAGVGGYAVTALACTVLAAAWVAWGGMGRAPAVLLGTLLSFVLYTGVVVWAFHVRSLRRVAAVLAGSALLLGAAFWVLKGWI